MSGRSQRFVAAVCVRPTEPGVCVAYRDELEKREQLPRRRRGKSRAASERGVLLSQCVSAQSAVFATGDR